MSDISTYLRFGTVGWVGCKISVVHEGNKTTRIWGKYYDTYGAFSFHTTYHSIGYLIHTTGTNDEERGEGTSATATVTRVDTTVHALLHHLDTALTTYETVVNAVNNGGAQDDAGRVCALVEKGIDELFMDALYAISATSATSDPREDPRLGYLGHVHRCKDMSVRVNTIIANIPPTINNKGYDDVISENAAHRKLVFEYLRTDKRKKASQKARKKARRQDSVTAAHTAPAAAAAIGGDEVETGEEKQGVEEEGAGFYPAATVAADGDLIGQEERKTYPADAGALEPGCSPLGQTGDDSCEGDSGSASVDDDDGGSVAPRGLANGVSGAGAASAAGGVSDEVGAAGMGENSQVRRVNITTWLQFCFGCVCVCACMCMCFTPLPCQLAPPSWASFVCTVYVYAFSPRIPTTTPDPARPPTTGA